MQGLNIPNKTQDSSISSQSSIANICKNIENNEKTKAEAEIILNRNNKQGNDSCDTSEDYHELNRAGMGSQNSLASRELPFLKEIQMMKGLRKVSDYSEDSLEEPPIKWCTPFIEPSTEILLDSLEDMEQQMEFSSEDVDDDIDARDHESDEEDDQAVQMCERYVPPADLFMDTIMEVSEENDTNDELDDMHAVIDINVGYNKRDKHHSRFGPIYLTDTDDFAIDLDNIDREFEPEFSDKKTNNLVSHKSIKQEKALEQETVYDKGIKEGGLFLPGLVATSPPLISKANPLPKPPRSLPKQEVRNEETDSQWQKITQDDTVIQSLLPDSETDNHQEFKEIEEYETLSRNRRALDNNIKSNTSNNNKNNKTRLEKSLKAGRRPEKNNNTARNPESSEILESAYCVRNMAQFWEEFCLRVQQEAELLTSTPTPNSNSNSTPSMNRKKWKSMPDLEESHEQRKQASSTSSREDLSMANTTSSADNQVIKFDDVVDDLEVCKTVSIRERCQLFEHLAARAASEAKQLMPARRQWSSMPSLKSPGAGRRKRQQWENSSLRPTSQKIRHQERPATSCGLPIRPVSPISRKGSHILFSVNQGFENKKFVEVDKWTINANCW